MESKLAFMVAGRAKQWASFAMALCVGLLFSRKLAGFQRQPHMSYSLNSLKGGYIGDFIGDYYRGYEGGY